MWLVQSQLLTFYFVSVCYIAAQTDYRSQNAASGNKTEDFTLNHSVCTTDGNCYYIYSFREPTNKYLADIHCQERNQTLATLDNRIIQNKLQQKIDSAAWTGLSVQSTVPNITWSTGDGFVQMSDDADLQRSIKDKKFGRCLLVNNQELWRAQCGHMMPYICEFTREPPLIACTYLRAQLEDKWLCSDLDDGTDRRQADKRTFVDAQKFCTSRKGNVVIVDSKEKLDNLTDLLRTENDKRPEGSARYGHFWTAGSQSKLVWTEKGINLNGYSLTWSPRDYNPNIEETMRGSYAQCIALVKSGLDFRKCEESNQISQVICSKRALPTTIPPTVRTSPVNPTTSDKAMLDGSQPLSNLRNIVSSFRPPSRWPKSKDLSTQPGTTIPITSTSVKAIVAGKPVKNGTADSKSDKRNAYQTIIICSYVLAGLFVLGLVLLIIILVRRRKQRSKLFNVASKTGPLGNGSLGRQRSTDPAVEWEKVLNDSETQPMLGKKDRNGSIDIIHNVPLDPRGDPEIPPNIPGPEYMTLSRSKKSGSRCSSSVSSEPQSSFTDRSRLRNSPSDSSLAPPLPPKSATLTRTLPPRIPDMPAYDDSCDMMTLDDTTKFPPPPDELLHDDKPALPPKPAKKPLPRRHKKKRHAPSEPTGDIYAKVHKNRTPSYQSSHHTLPPPQLSPLSDTGDSGIDDNLIHSPRNNVKQDTHKTPSEEVAFLDSIIASF